MQIPLFFSVKLTPPLVKKTGDLARHHKKPLKSKWVQANLCKHTHTHTDTMVTMIDVNRPRCNA